MVQLSIQDMTQESKVRAGVSWWEVCARTCMHIWLGRTVLGMKFPL